MLEEIIFWLLLVVAVLAGIVVLLLLVGSFMPRSHVVSRSIHLEQPRETVWQAITDHAGVPAWYKGVLSAERLTDRCGHEVWRETYKGGFPIQLETVEAIAPELLVRLIVDEKGPYSGRWEFLVTEEAPGSRMTVTEFGVITNPFIRLMARLVMNPARYLEEYLTAVAEKFGEKASLEI